MTERIAFVLPDLGGGGAERVAITLAHEMVALGHEIDFVLGNRRGELLSEVPEEARVIDLRASRLSRTLRPLARYFRDERPAAALVFMWPLTSVSVVARGLSRQRMNLVLTDHSTESVAYAGRGRLHHQMLRASMALYRWADSRIAVSEGVADDSASLSGLARSRFLVVPNPVPPPASVPGTKPDELWDVPPGRRILHVGSFKPAKDHRTLLNAFAAMKPGEDDRLVLLGDGPLRPAIEELIIQLGIASSVMTPGYTSEKDRYLASADLFVLSSSHEGFGLVLVEALAHGLPIVSTDCSTGPAEILDGGRLGRLVPVGDTDALAGAMKASLSEVQDPSSRMRRIARAADYAPRPIAERYLDILLARGIERSSP